MLAGAAICVIQEQPGEYRWAANLWYTDLGHNSQYRWWEVLYMHSPLA